MIARKQASLGVETDMMKKKLPWRELFWGLVALNLIALDVLFIFSLNKERLSFTLPEGSPSSNLCPLTCQEQFNELLTSSLATFSATRGEEKVEKPTPTSCPKCQVSTPQPQAKAVYIPLASSGSTVKMDWTDVVPSNFYFDLVDYPGAKSVRFEAYLKALNGSATIYLRLYDDTNKRAVDYSDLSTTSPTFELQTSSPLTIWRGNNLYKIQIKSLNGTEAFFQEARLKILF
jgi:hypothetical protein